MDINEQREAERLQESIPILASNGFEQVSGWLFVKNSQVYDLSAADLEQTDRIERDGLFVKGPIGQDGLFVP